MQELLPKTKGSRTTLNTGTAPAASPPAVPRFSPERWSNGFFANLKDFLTERPVKLPPSATKTALREEQFGGSLWENFREWLRPLPPSLRHGAHSRMEVEWKPWYRVFWENLRDAIARLLIEFKAREAVPALLELAASGRTIDHECAE